MSSKDSKAKGKMPSNPYLTFPPSYGSAKNGIQTAEASSSQPSASKPPKVKGLRKPDTMDLIGSLIGLDTYGVASEAYKDRVKAAATDKNGESSTAATSHSQMSPGSGVVSPRLRRSSSPNNKGKTKRMKKPSMILSFFKRGFSRKASNASFAPRVPSPKHGSTKYASPKHALPKHAPPKTSSPKDMGPKTPQRKAPKAKNPSPKSASSKSSSSSSSSSSSPAMPPLKVVKPKVVKPKTPAPKTPLPPTESPPIILPPVETPEAEAATMPWKFAAKKENVNPNKGSGNNGNASSGNYILSSGNIYGAPYGMQNLAKAFSQVPAQKPYPYSWNPVSASAPGNHGLYGPSTSAAPPLNHGSHGHGFPAPHGPSVEEMRAFIKQAEWKAGMRRANLEMMRKTHFCNSCGRVRSRRYHQENPVEPNHPVRNYCSKCRMKLWLDEERKAQGLDGNLSEDLTQTSVDVDESNSPGSSDIPNSSSHGSFGGLGESPAYSVVLPPVGSSPPPGWPSSAPPPIPTAAAPVPAPPTPAVSDQSDEPSGIYEASPEKKDEKKADKKAQGSATGGGISSSAGPSTKKEADEGEEGDTTSVYDLNSDEEMSPAAPISVSPSPNGTASGSAGKAKGKAKANSPGQYCAPTCESVADSHVGSGGSDSGEPSGSVFSGAKPRGKPSAKAATFLRRTSPAEYQADSPLTKRALEKEAKEKKEKKDKKDKETAAAAAAAAGTTSPSSRSYTYPLGGGAGPATPSALPPSPRRALSEGLYDRGAYQQPPQQTGAGGSGAFAPRTFPVIASPLRPQRRQQLSAREPGTPDSRAQMPPRRRYDDAWAAAAGSTTATATSSPSFSAAAADSVSDLFRRPSGAANNNGGLPPRAPRPAFSRPAWPGQGRNKENEGKGGEEDEEEDDVFVNKRRS